jgi:hypothetical protein
MRPIRCSDAVHVLSAAARILPTLGGKHFGRGGMMGGEPA